MPAPKRLYDGFHLYPEDTLAERMFPNDPSSRAFRVWVVAKVEQRPRLAYLFPLRKGSLLPNEVREVDEQLQAEQVRVVGFGDLINRSIWRLFNPWSQRWIAIRGL